MSSFSEIRILKTVHVHITPKHFYENGDAVSCVKHGSVTFRLKICIRDFSRIS